jgi:hypothetical protein
MVIYGDGKHNENMEHVPKNEYDFYIDRKMTVWVREYHTVKADTLDEAKTKMIDAFKNDYYDDTFYEQDTLYDTMESIEPGDNAGDSTLELYCDEGDGYELLKTNID